MKRILVVGGSSKIRLDRESLYLFTDYLKGLLSSKDYSFESCFLDDLKYSISPGSFKVYDSRNKVDLDGFDVVHIQVMRRQPNQSAYYLSRYCAWANKNCVYDYSLYMPAGKLGQTIVFLEQGVNFLRTVYSQNNKQVIRLAAKEFGYPYILKAVVTSRGNYNHLIKTADQAKRIVEDNPGIDYLAQQFCPNDLDYRLLIVGDKYLIIERRGDENSHLNNSSKGAKTRIVEGVIPAENIAEARRLMKSLDIQIAGVDIMPDKYSGELYFLEVNIQPQLRTGSVFSDKAKLVKDFYDSI